MTEPDDISLLREFAATESEAAFTALVSRHVNLVYSVALRSTGNTHAAQEISQAVFIILARKARALGAKTVVSGWLYQTTRLTAANFLRGEIRRQQREQEAYMRSTLNEPEASAWPQIAPLLDDALGRLGERDRNAIVLRFLENRSLREVGAALGASEDAAKLRVRRALEKLRKNFGKRGVTLTATVIAGAVSAGSVQAAPVGLATSISTVALTKGAAAGGSTLTLVKGALELMAWTNVKTALLTGATIAVLGGSITAGIAIHDSRSSEAGLKLFKQVQQKYASLDSLSYEGTGVFQARSKTNRSAFSVRLGRPCSYRTEMQTSGSSPAETLNWSTDDFAMWDVPWLQTLYKIKSTPEERLKHYDGLGLDSGVPSCIPTEFFYASDSQNPFTILSRTNTEVAISISGAETVAGHACHRLALALPPQNKTLNLWIGADDFLIYRTEVRWEKAESTMINHRMVYSSATQSETYTRILTNPLLQPDDFIPESIPPGLTVKESFP